MSKWWNYIDKTPISLADVKHLHKYFYLPGSGQNTGVVTALTVEPKDGINVEYEDDKTQDIILETDTQKKLYEIIKGGKRSGRNKKTKKQRKNYRKTNRRIH